jgi:hypothetical protein
MCNEMTERLPFDLNTDPQCLLKVEIGDYVWVDRTLYEVYGFDGPNALLRWSQPLRIRGDIPIVDIARDI